MASYTVSERDMLITIVAVLESEDEITLANIMKVSKFVFNPQWEFSYVLPDQKKLYATLKVPVNYKKYIKDNLVKISDIAIDIYNDDEDYRFLGINDVGVMPIQTEELEFENKRVLLEKDSIFSNFTKYLINNTKINELQKKYLFEACEDGNSGNILSATVMLGCSAEMLLLDLCDAYYKYLQNHGTDTECNNFSQKVLHAKVAFNRLDEFLKRIEPNPSVFVNLGFENLKVNFNFLDVIRQTRNDSGHPTGNMISQEQFKMMLSNYQSFLDKALNAVEQLPIL